MRAFLSAFAVLCSACTAFAQEQITPDQFLDIATGRTLEFSALISGRVVGTEQFLRRDLSVWTDVTGRCTYGRIEVRGLLLCFHYEDRIDEQNCWTTYNDQGTLLVMSATSGQVQRITDINDTSLGCGIPVS